MPTRIRRIDYFYCMAKDQPGEGYKLLSQLAAGGVNLLAFSAVPVGPMLTQLIIFPEDADKLTSTATRSGLSLEGPHHALLVQGDDELGALAEIHARLYRADVNVSSASGVTDGRGSFGYLIYVRPLDFDRAAAALEL